MIKSFWQLNIELWNSRKIIFSMGKAEFRNEYVGSALGIIWGVLKPFMMVLVYSVVFTDKVADIPFFVWVIPGLFLWTFLSDSLVAGTSAIRGNGHLVKKVVFPISVLPAVKIVSNLMNHLIFMTFAVIILLLNGHGIHLATIQLFYYLIASVVFTLAITRLLSAMAVMSVDIVHFIMTIMQLLFWMSPVVWEAYSPNRPILKALLPLLKLNPYFYLLEGYRNSLFRADQWFWNDAGSLLYFWCVTLVIFLFGSYYYEKNRQEFADVL